MGNAPSLRADRLPGENLAGPVTCWRAGIELAIRACITGLVFRVGGGRGVFDVPKCFGRGIRHVQARQICGTKEWRSHTRHARRGAAYGDELQEATTSRKSGFSRCMHTHLLSRITAFGQRSLAPEAECGKPAMRHPSSGAKGPSDRHLRMCHSRNDWFKGGATKSPQDRPAPKKRLAGAASKPRNAGTYGWSSSKRARANQSTILLTISQYVDIKHPW
jgi:hypothetical protein